MLPWQCDLRADLSMSQLAIASGIWVLTLWQVREWRRWHPGCEHAPQRLFSAADLSSTPVGSFLLFAGEIVLLACQRGSARNVRWASCWSRMGGTLACYAHQCEAPVLYLVCTHAMHTLGVGRGVLRGVRAHSEAARTQPFWGVLTAHCSQGD